MATPIPTESEIDRKWFVMDADGQVLGRLATRVATILRGKHKSTFTPHLGLHTGFVESEGAHGDLHLALGTFLQTLDEFRREIVRFLVALER